MQLSGIHRGDRGLIQAVADNFDADILSQNGKVTTHTFPMLMSQMAFLWPQMIVGHTAMPNWEMVFTLFGNMHLDQNLMLKTMVATDF